MRAVRIDSAILHTRFYLPGAIAALKADRVLRNIFAHRSERIQPRGMLLRGSRGAGEVNRDAAWYYPDPKAAAAEIKDRIAFWKGVAVT